MVGKEVTRGKGPWPQKNDLRSVRAWLAERLGGAAGRETENIARLLLDHVSGMPRMDRIAKDWRANESTLERLAVFADRVRAGEPVQYVLGKTHFFGLDFLCDRRALIPRPETEELLAETLKRVANRGSLRVLDIGTGTGILPICWKARRPQDVVFGVDVEGQALALAADNAERNGVTVHWHQIDVLDEAALGELAKKPFDVILSNPPYIPRAEAAEMSETVREWEPDSALFVADADPLVFYRRIVRGCAEQGWLAAEGWLAMECHRDGTEAVAALISAPWADPCRVRDLQGNWRMVMAQWPPVKA